MHRFTPLILLILCLTSCRDDPSPTLPTPAPSILDTPGCLLGAHLGEASVADFEAATGKHHVVYSCYLKLTSMADLRGTAWSAWAAALPAHAVPLIMIEPHNPAMSIFTSLTTADSASIAAFATSCAALTSRVLVSFGHEMNGWWYSWGQKPAVFVAAYRSFSRIMKRVAGDRVAMCWIPNQAWDYPRFGQPDSVRDRTLLETNAYSDYFPGIASVDWVGLTYYPTGHAQDDPWHFIAAVEHLNFYATYSAAMARPMMLAETAYKAAEGSMSAQDIEAAKRTWIGRVYNPDTLRSRFPNIKALVWFNVRKVENDGQTHDFRIPAGTAYSSAISSSHFLAAWP